MSQGLHGERSTPGDGPDDPAEPLTSEAAFAAALDALLDALWRHTKEVCRTLGFGAYAADIAVDVMLKYQGKLRAAHEVGDHTLFDEMRRAPRLTRWVQREALNRGLNRRKKEDADMRHDLAFHATQELRESPFEDPAQFAERQEIRRLVEAKLARMPEAHRKVIALRIVGYSWDEVVEMLGIPKRTAQRYEAEVFERLKHAPSLAQYDGWERGSQPVPREDDTP